MAYWPLVGLVECLGIGTEQVREGAAGVDLAIGLPVLKQLQVAGLADLLALLIVLDLYQ
jgi:hypothetical protein